MSCTGEIFFQAAIEVWTAIATPLTLSPVAFRFVAIDVLRITVFGI